MSDLNQFCCTGNLGGDAETKDFDGRIKARYRVAISGRKESTTWLTCDHWDCHQNLVPHLTKGKKVAIAGRIEEQSWTAKDGTPKSAIVLVVGNVTLLGGKEPEPEQERRPTVIQGAGRKPKWESDATPF
jgi:single-strand DNA-binding protein